MYRSKVSGEVEVVWLMPGRREIPNIMEAESVIVLGRIGVELIE